MENEFVVTQRRGCPICDGSGYTALGLCSDGYTWSKCVTCNGTGTVREEVSLKDAIKCLDWSSWIKNLGADVANLEQRLQETEEWIQAMVDSIKEPVDLRREINRLYRLISDLEKRVTRNETDLSMYDDTFHTELNIYEERLRALEAQAEQGVGVEKSYHINYLQLLMKQLKEAGATDIPENRLLEHIRTGRLHV